MNRREWVELRIAQIQRRLRHSSVPPGFRDHRNERERDELWRLQRELNEKDCND